MASGGGSTAKKTSGARKPGRPAGSTNKSTSAAATRRKTTSKKQTAVQKNPILDEICVLLIFACTIILILSNFNLAGIVGEKIKWFMFGLFGVMEYLVPFIIAATLIFQISNREYMSVARLKSAAVYMLTILVSAAWQCIIDKPQIQKSTPIDIFWESAKNFNGGGLFGGILCKILSPLGTVGSMVILLLLAIICIILITEHSFISGVEYVKKSGTRMVHAAKQDYDIYREHSVNKRNANPRKKLSEEEYLEQRRIETERRIQEKEERTQAKKLARSQRKALGVTTATELPKLEEVQASPIDIHEIQVDTERMDEYTEDIYIPEEFTEEITDIGQNLESNLIEDDINYEEEQWDYEIESVLAQEDELEAEMFDDNTQDSMINSVSERLAQLGYSNEQPDSMQSDNAFADNLMEAYEPVKPYDSEDDEPVEAEDLEEENVIVQPETSEDEELEAAVQRELEQQEQTYAKLVQEIDKEDNKPEYQFPPLSLLTEGRSAGSKGQEQENKATAMRLQQTLQNFGVKVTITDISCGPAVTRYELQPEQGVKVSKIVSLSDDIKLNLAAADIRIEAPIPGKAAIGIEVPNKVAGSVTIRELLESENFIKSASPITFAVGKDIAGKTIVTDIAKMPHLLIAGATGSGKSVCINTIIMSILYKANPEDVKMIMIDPKMVELRVYDGIPHLMIPVVIDPKKASGALNWAVNEMTDRYKKFAQLGVRDLKGYNKKIQQLEIPEGEERPKKMPQLVIIIDELADLMMVAPGEVEDAICRLAQLARAAGIHLVIATQRPSVNVITGLIKANVPSRIAFSVSSGVDSRTIIDMNGAEKLLGKGDMLFFPSGYPKPLRVQGAFVSDDEVSAVVDFLKENSKQVEYDEHIADTITSAQSQTVRSQSNERDSYFEEAARFVIEKEKGSIGMLQRYYKIGFNRAARLMDQLAEAGVVGPEIGTKPRKILMTAEEFEAYLKNNS